MQPDYGALGATIRGARERRGLTQREIARKIDYTEKQYAMLERGEIDKRGPGLGFLTAVSEAVDLPLPTMLRAAGLPGFEVSEQVDETLQEIPRTQRQAILNLIRTLAPTAAIGATVTQSVS